MKKARVIALYLPQYHPIPENDAWWGPGFTEWTNTAKAKPMFRGHYQPHVPRDLGFYDLRLDESRVQQAALAKEYGIEGFCYYHYWFGNGERILERPFQEVLSSGSPDFPFCLCWANQTWSGIWHGAPNQILKEQTYPGEHDDIAHFNTLLPAFRDPRYIKVDGKPMFVIYRPTELPKPKATLDLWRRLALEAGLEGIHFVAQRHAEMGEDWDPATLGFDASYISRMPPKHAWVSKRQPLTWLKFTWAKYRGYPTIYDHRKVFDAMLPRKRNDIRDYPCVVPNWDNSPRSGKNGLVLTNSSPALLRRSLQRALEILADRPASHQIIMLKSWNEWAEGNYVEPDMVDGRTYLEAIKQEIDG